MRRGPEVTERRRSSHLYGLKAESIAALLLRLKGYTILARRFVVSGGEIDLQTTNVATTLGVTSTVATCGYSYGVRMPAMPTSTSV